MRARILLVEDEVNMARTLAKNLARAGHAVDHAPNGEEALTRLGETRYDVVLTDLKMPVLDGMGLLHAMHERRLSPAVVVLTGYGTIESAVEAMKLGAADYLIKDARPQEILLTIERVLRMDALRRENDQLREAMKQLRGFGELIGQSVAMQPIYRVIDAVRENKSTVLRFWLTASIRRYTACMLALCPISSPKPRRRRISRRSVAFSRLSDDRLSTRSSVSSISCGRASLMR